MTISNPLTALELSPFPGAKNRSAGGVLSDEKPVRDAGPKVEMPNPAKLKAVLAEHDISLNFRRDEASGRMVIEMVDSRTGDAVRQIPSEVSLRLSELFSKISGQLFEARA